MQPGLQPPTPLTLHMSTRHLDLGCGLTPRNPYGHTDLYGCDIRSIEEDLSKIGFHYRQVNLTLEPLPFPDDYFDSISAFDFLEHVPRQIALPSGQTTGPFINLMNEIFRTLKPGGRFLALTPAYPHPAVFSDPTHVNFITAQTHEYFVGPQPGGAIYGFKGHFEALTVRWETPGNSYRLDAPTWRQALRRVHRRWLGGGLSHQLWEFKAVKSQT